MEDGVDIIGRVDNDKGHQDNGAELLKQIPI